MRVHSVLDVVVGQSLDNHFPLGIVGEIVILENVTVVERANVGDIDLLGLKITANN